MSKNFSDKKEHYVYVYLNPETEMIWEENGKRFEYAPFYIGIGQNKRMYQHLIDSYLNGGDSNKDKI